MTPKEIEEDDETNAMVGDMIAKEASPEEVRRYGMELLKRRVWDELGVTVEGNADLPVKRRYDDTLSDRGRQNRREEGYSDYPGLKQLEKEMEDREGAGYTVDEFELDKRIKNKPRSL